MQLHRRSNSCIQIRWETVLWGGRRCYSFRSRIHECTISLRFLGIILGVLRLEVPVWISWIAFFLSGFCPKIRPLAPQVSISGQIFNDDVTVYSLPQLFPPYRLKKKYKFIFLLRNFWFTDSEISIQFSLFSEWNRLENSPLWHLY
jgi:hypothetical protein